MIQRIQTVWLLLVAVCAVIAFFVPFGIEHFSDLGPHGAGDIKMTGLNNSTVLTFCALIIVESLVSLFLFKNRKIQKFGCYFLIILSISCLGAMIYFTEFQKEGTTQLYGIVLPVLMIIFSVLALRGISKDDKLVKSLDRLR